MWYYGKLWITVKYLSESKPKIEIQNSCEKICTSKPWPFWLKALSDSTAEVNFKVVTNCSLNWPLQCTQICPHRYIDIPAGYATAAGLVFLLFIIFPSNFVIINMSHDGMVKLIIVYIHDIMCKPSQLKTRP